LTSCADGGAPGGVKRNLSLSPEEIEELTGIKLTYVINMAFDYWR